MKHGHMVPWSYVDAMAPVHLKIILFDKYSISIRGRSAIYS